MIYGFLAIFFNSLESVLFGHVFYLLNPFIFLIIFYATSSTILTVVAVKNKSFKSKNNEARLPKELIFFILAGFAANALWFSSLYIIGISSITIIAVLQRLFMIFYSVTALTIL